MPPEKDIFDTYPFLRELDWSDWDPGFLNVIKENLDEAFQDGKFDLSILQLPEGKEITDSINAHLKKVRPLLLSTIKKLAANDCGASYRIFALQTLLRMGVQGKIVESAIPELLAALEHPPSSQWGQAYAKVIVLVMLCNSIEKIGIKTRIGLLETVVDNLLSALSWESYVASVAARMLGKLVEEKVGEEIKEESLAVIMDRLLLEVDAIEIVGDRSYKHDCRGKSRGAAAEVLGAVIERIGIEKNFDIIMEKLLSVSKERGVPSSSGHFMIQVRQATKTWERIAKKMDKKMLDIVADRLLSKLESTADRGVKAATILALSRIIEGMGKKITKEKLEIIVDRLLLLLEDPYLQWSVLEALSTIIAVVGEDIRKEKIETILDKALSTFNLHTDHRPEIAMLFNNIAFCKEISKEKFGTIADVLLPKLLVSSYQPDAEILARVLGIVVTKLSEEKLAATVDNLLSNLKKACSKDETKCRVIYALGEVVEKVGEKIKRETLETMVDPLLSWLRSDRPEVLNASKTLIEIAKKLGKDEIVEIVVDRLLPMPNTGHTQSLWTRISMETLEELVEKLDKRRLEMLADCLCSELKALGGCPADPRIKAARALSMVAKRLDQEKLNVVMGRLLLALGDDSWDSCDGRGPQQSAAEALIEITKENVIGFIRSHLDQWQEVVYKQRVEAEIRNQEEKVRSAAAETQSLAEAITAVTVEIKQYTDNATSIAAEIKKLVNTADAVAGETKKQTDIKFSENLRSYAKKNDSVVAEVKRQSDIVITTAAAIKRQTEIAADAVTKVEAQRCADPVTVGEISKLADTAVTALVAAKEQFAIIVAALESAKANITIVVEARKEIEQVVKEHEIQTKAEIETERRAQLARVKAAKRKAKKALKVAQIERDAARADLRAAQGKIEELEPALRTSEEECQRLVAAAAAKEVELTTIKGEAEEAKGQFIAEISRLKAKLEYERKERQEGLQRIAATLNFLSGCCGNNKGGQELPVRRAGLFDARAQTFAQCEVAGDERRLDELTTEIANPKGVGTVSSTP